MQTEIIRSIETQKLIFPGRGNPQAKLMIIGSHPNKDDLENKELVREVYHFGNGCDTANELKKALEVNQFDLNNIWYTTICKSGIGSKSKPSAQDIKAGYALLEEELQTIKPDLIVALGSEAFKRVMRKNIKVGDYLGVIRDCPYGKVLANHSPGTVIAVDPTKRNEFQEIFELAKSYIDNKLNYTPFNYHIIKDIKVAKAIIEYYIENKKFDIGYDLEWKGKKWTDDEVLYTFQFSCEDHEAFIFDLTSDGVHENLELLDCAKPLLEHPKARRLGWNIRADDKRLVKRGFKLSDETLVWDGMKAMYAFDSRWGKGLEIGIKKFTNYDPYYNEFNIFMQTNKIDKGDMCDVKFKNPNLFYRYCGGDAVSHRLVCLNQIQNFPAELLTYFRDVYMPMGNYFLDMEMTGIPVDPIVMTDITNKYESKYNELASSLNEKLKELGIENFNYNSAQQKKLLLFKTLSLKPVYYTKAGKSAKPRAWYERQKPATQALFSPSTNGKSLSTMVFELQEKIKAAPESLKIELEKSYNIVKNLLDLNRISVFSNKFLSKRGMISTDLEDLIESDEVDEIDDQEPLKQSYWAATCADGRIHADFFECLKNFRSSSRVNVQNPASKVIPHVNKIFVPNFDKLSKEEKAIVENTIIPKNIRNIFYSGDPDWYYVCADIAGADLAIQAFLSGDPDFISDIRSGSFHTIKMRDYFQRLELTKDDVAEYTIGKAITFRCSYSAELKAAAEPIQAEIFAETGLYVELERIEYALGTWNKYIKYINYREACKQEVMEYARITNARNMVLYFEETDNWAIRAGYFNESLAYPIAGELALYAYNCCVNLRKHFKKAGYWMRYVKPVNIVHDDIQFIIHKDMMKDNYFPEVMKHFMCEETTIVTGDKLGMEITVSDRWKGKNKIFSKETKWDNDSQKWLWKD
jgi:uracil-DNA glycosylase